MFVAGLGVLVFGAEPLVRRCWTWAERTSDTLTARRGLYRGVGSEAGDLCVPPQRRPFPDGRGVLQRGRRPPTRPGPLRCHRNWRSGCIRSDRGKRAKWASIWPARDPGASPTKSSRELRSDHDGLRRGVSRRTRVRRLDWPMENPKGQPIEKVRAIRRRDPRPRGEAHRCRGLGPRMIGGRAHTPRSDGSAGPLSRPAAMTAALAESASAASSTSFACVPIRSQPSAAGVSSWPPRRELPHLSASASPEPRGEGGPADRHRAYLGPGAPATPRSSGSSARHGPSTVISMMPRRTSATPPRRKRGGRRTGAGGAGAGAATGAGAREISGVGTAGRGGTRRGPSLISLGLSASTRGRRSPRPLSQRATRFTNTTRRNSARKRICSGATLLPPTVSAVEPHRPAGRATRASPCPPARSSSGSSP
jgi:hypothetical protein